MFESSQNWELFGYDMRNLGRHWVSAWRDLLWGYDSPVRQRLDDAVSLRSEGSVACYQGGRPSEAGTPGHTAILLPEELVLTRTLSLPVVVETDLPAVLALEVGASSPFSAEDTGYGWQIVSRDEAKIQVVLVILSRKSTIAYLGRQFAVHDARQQEVWVRVGGAMVVVQGFGEELRDASYKKRLVRTAAMLAVAAVLILCVTAVAAGMKGLELQRVQGMSTTTEREAADASRMRTSLASANEMIAAANRIATTYPNPHLEISRLTHLLDDGESIDQFSMRGLEIELRGQAADAASVMQRLTEQPDYAEVTAPSAFTRIPGAQVEQFSLQILLREVASQ